MLKDEELSYRIRGCVADIVVEGKVVLELKAQSMLSPMHEAQLFNYMRAGGLKLGNVIYSILPSVDSVANCSRG